MSWGLAAGMLAGGLADMFGGNSAQKKQQANLNKIIEQYMQLGGHLNTAGGQALQQRRRALGDVRGGFDQALAELSGAGQAAQTAARDVAQRDFGYAQQALLDAGQFDVQGLTTARRGISSDLSRNIAGIMQATAQQRAGVLGQRGLSMANARGGIADQYMQNYQGRAGIASGIAGALGNVQYTSSPMGGAFGALGYGLEQMWNLGGGKTDFAGNASASAGSGVA